MRSDCTNAYIYQEEAAPILSQMKRHFTLAILTAVLTLTELVLLVSAVYGLRQLIYKEHQQLSQDEEEDSSVKKKDIFNPTMSKLHFTSTIFILIIYCSCCSFYGYLQLISSCEAGNCTKMINSEVLMF